MADISRNSTEVAEIAVIEAKIGDAEIEDIQKTKSSRKFPRFTDSVLYEEDDEENNWNFWDPLPILLVTFTSYLILRFWE